MLAIVAAWSSFAACSDDDGAPGAPDAGASGAGAASTGGTAGAGGVGGGAGHGGSSAGGTAGAGAQWGAYPVWESIPGGALDCKFERLANAASVRIFEWQPCAGGVGCEQARFHPALVSIDPQFAGSTAHDDGVQTRVGLHFITPFDVVFVASAEGMGLDGFRAVDVQPKCRLSGAKVWKQRLAIKIRPWDSLDRHGGILADIASNSQPAFFEAPQPLPPGGPAPHAIGDSRWLWWWAPKNSLTSVSTVDGSGFAQFATADSPNLIFSDASSTGSLFLFNHLFTADSGTLSWQISYSDGIVEPKPYLIPPPDSHYGGPAYAHTHVGFLRGINQVDLNKYESVELWASVYSSDPSTLQPEFVGPTVYTSIGTLAGGWGYVGLHDLLSPGDQHGVQIWNLETKTKVTHPIPDGQIGVGGLLGMTRTHFWLGTAIKGKSGLRYLLRYPVE